MIQLERVAQPLPRASVVDTEGLSPLPEFESRYGKRFGWFITEREIRSATGSRLSDLILTKIPGLHVSGVQGGGAIAYSTRGPRSIRGDLCTIAVYLDGVRVSSGEVDVVPLSLLAGVEYYSPGFVPVQYRTLGAECGVMLLWTVH
jgi:TonB-dependent Receptor Plug Domain